MYKLVKLFIGLALVCTLVQCKPLSSGFDDGLSASEAVENSASSSGTNPDENSDTSGSSTASESQSIKKQENEAELERSANDPVGDDEPLAGPKDEPQDTVKNKQKSQEDKDESEALENKQNSQEEVELNYKQEKRNTREKSMPNPKDNSDRF